jgi:hypothetical protein
MLPASGSGEILQETPFIPAVSRPDCNESARKNIRNMEAVFPPEFRRTGTVTIRVFPLTGNKTETFISCRISKGISQYPSGIDRKQEHIRPSTTHPRLFLGFHQTFPSISQGFH